MLIRSLVPAAALAAVLPAQDPAALDRTGQAESPPLIRLRDHRFDPATGEPTIPALLRAGDDTGLWIVQFDGTPTETGRAAVRAKGGEVFGYLPDHAHVVRGDAAVAAAVLGLPGVRAVRPYHPAYRLETALRTALASGRPLPTARYHVVVVDKHRDKPALAAKVLAIGGEIAHEQEGSILFDVVVDDAGLLQLARFDEVLWIDRWTPPEEDMDNARIQGGGNYVEAQGGLTGAGLSGHVYEGVQSNHPDFNTAPTPVLSCGSAESHGHATAGIVFGNGTSNPAVRGMAPDAVPFFTNYSCVNSGVSRWQVVDELVNRRGVSFTTASWGNARTTQYTSISADADDIVFDHDIAWTQSQSNAGNPQSRPQAWAKNIFSIGGVAHGNNADRRDDSWAAGGGSTGPAADGRIKPTLAAYYDSIGTSDRTGSAGYSNGDWTSSFGGTSGATPIVAGHNALAIQMFTDFVFNNTPRVPGGTRHQNRPHFTTLKAMMVASARQYPFTSSSTDNRREHVGFGFPDLRTMWDNRSRTLIVDETDVLTQGNSTLYSVQVQPNDPELKVVLNWNEPAANPGAASTLINDLSLKVTDPAGTVYWGNNGLWNGNYSTPGGTANTVDSIEAVLVNQPDPGAWTVEVIATRIAQDNHVETPTIDADYGLAVAFGTVNGALRRFGDGCQGTGTTPNACDSLNGNGGTLTGATRTNEYAYTVTTAQARSVTGFRIFTASATGSPVTVRAALYADVGGAPATTPLQQTTMTVGAAPGFYEAILGTPVSVNAGQRFYISLDHNAGAVVSTLTSGQGGEAFWRRPPFAGGAFARSQLVTAPAWQILCAGGGQTGAVPAFDLAGSPAPGSSLTARLTQAAPRAAAVLLSGVSDSTWAGGNLPFDLGGLGATNCALLVSTEFPLRTQTDANGRATTGLPIPADSNLVGLRLYHQFAVLDAGANALGLALSNAFATTVGG